MVIKYLNYKMANQSNQRSYTLGAYSVCMNTRCCFLMLDIASFLRNDVTTSTTIGIIPPQKNYQHTYNCNISYARHICARLYIEKYVYNLTLVLGSFYRKVGCSLCYKDNASLHATGSSQLIHM